MLKRTPDGIDLTTFSLPAAFGLAVSMSGKADYAIASSMGWAQSQASRIFNCGDDYWPSLPSIPRLCSVLGNTVLLDWMAAQAGISYQPVPAQVADVPKLLQGLDALLHEVAHVVSECGTAAADGVLEHAEARRIVNRLNAMIASAAPLMASLQACREQGGCS